MKVDDFFRAISQTKEETCRKDANGTRWNIRHDRRINLEYSEV